LKDECRMSNGSKALAFSHFGIRTSHFATVAERAFVAERLAQVNVAFDDPAVAGRR